MDLLQKSSTLVVRQRIKAMKEMKDDKHSNKIAEALKLFLKTQNIAPNYYANQEAHLKSIQAHFLNLCQRELAAPHEFVHVKILNGVSPTELFVIRRSDVEKANDFHGKLTADYTSDQHQLVYCLKKGVICVAYTTKGWQRCRILKLYEEHSCDILLFDIGLEECVDWLNLRMIGDKWIDFKPLAIQCSLVNITTARSIVHITPQQQHIFSQTLKNQNDFYIFVNRPSITSLDIFLYYKFDDQFYCVNDILSSGDNSQTTESSENIESIAASNEASASAQSQSIVEESPHIYLNVNQNVDKDEEESPHIDLNVNQNVDKDEEESQYSIPQLEKLCRCSKPEPVVVKNIDGIDGIYVCFEKYLIALNRLRFELHKYVQDNRSKDQLNKIIWKPGDYCLVFDSFEGYSEWLRGKIVSVLSADKYEVYLRDIGRAIESPRQNLMAITDKLKNVRNFTWKMKLAFIKIAKQSTVDLVKEVLYDTVSSYDGIAISAIGENHGTEWDIILWGIKKSIHALLPETFEYININQDLVKWGVATTRVSFDEINNLIRPQQYYEEPGEIQDDLPNQVTDQVMEVVQWIPTQPIFKREFVAFPMYVSQNCLLSVLEANRKAICEEITEILCRKHQANELVKQDALKWKKEDACFARFDGDRQFYRATIRRVNFIKNTCVVRFIDYGHCETCFLDDLRKANMFGDIPALARLYRLDNIKPTTKDGLWPDYVRQFCCNRVVGKQCNLIVTEISRDDSKSPYETDMCKLEIFTKDKDLATALVSRGYATWIDDSIKEKYIFSQSTLKL